MFSTSKAPVLNYLVQGGQLYWVFPLSKGSLAYLVQSFFHGLGLSVVLWALVVEGVAVPEHLAKVGKKLLHFGVLESQVGDINLNKLDRLV